MSKAKPKTAARPSTKASIKPAAKAVVRELIVVFGLDPDDKPRAAKFEAAQRDLVTKAAAAMNLQVQEVDAAKLASKLAKIPPGKAFSAGKIAVPYVRRELYAALLAAMGVVYQATTKPVEPPKPLAEGLPRTWDEFVPGHLVIAQETSLADGWWEAIVLEVEGDMLTLRWRDYPEQPKVTKHRMAVALLNPGPAV